MRVLIVIGLAMVIGIIGFIGTMEVSRRMQNAAAERQERPMTGNRELDMNEATRRFDRAAGDMAARQGHAVMGGGIGLALGAVTGIAIVARRERRSQNG